MTGDSHPTEQGAGKPLEAPQSREAPLVGTERRPGGEFGPQAATDGFDGPEIHHWDAAKTAEVARILAEHPPRHVGWITSNADQPETPMPEPTPAEHCGDARKHPAHKAMRGRRVFQCCGIVAQPSPAGVRDQIAAAIGDELDVGGVDALAAADAVLRVPAIAEALAAAGKHAALKRAHVALAEQAGKDQAALAETRNALAMQKGISADLRVESKARGDKLERVRAECDRIETAVRANPQDPDFDGAYLAAIGHIRRALNPQEQS